MTTTRPRSVLAATRTTCGTSPPIAHAGAAGVPRIATLLRRGARKRNVDAAAERIHVGLRALANRLVGVLHGCLEHRTPRLRFGWGEAPTSG